MKKQCIWIIDDDLIYKIVMKKIISKLGLEDCITTFSNGKEAIEALQVLSQGSEKIPAVILLDIEMPVLDGWGFMEEFQKMEFDAKKQISIYISSSSIAVEDKERAKNNKLIAGYMSKPIKMEDLVLILE